MDIVSIIVGFLLGVIGSLVAWGLLTFAIVPRVAFTSSLSAKKYPGAPAGRRHYMRVMNNGKRSVIDVKMIVRFRIKGLLENPNHWKNIDLALDEASCVSIGPGAYRDFFVFPEETDWNRYRFMPEGIRLMAAENTLRLEDLLELPYECYVKAHVFCYDSFTGARKLYSSNPYKREDVRS